MQWQDYVISISQIFFVIALIPSIRGQHKPDAITSVMFCTFVAIVGACLLSLELWISAATAFLGAIAWAILAVQKIKIDRANITKD